MGSLRDLVPQLAALFGDDVRDVLIAIIVLFVGWLVARIGAWVVKKGLESTTIDNRIAKWVLGDQKGEGFEVEAWVGKAVYYILLLFALVLFFNTLHLTVVSEPLITLLNKVFGYLPQLLGAVLLVALAWVVATVARKTVSIAADRWRLDEKVVGEAGLEKDAVPELGRTLGDGIYWLVFLLFLPIVLGTLNLGGLLSPVQAMMDRLLTFVPNILAAGLILAAGWLIARIVQRIVTNLLAAVGIDGLGEKIGLGTALGTRKLSGLVGLVVYVFILFNVILSSLNALALEAVTRPASQMLGQVLEAIPRLFAASVLLALAFFVGRLVAQLLVGVLAGAGFDSVLDKLGLAIGSTTSSGERPSGKQPSDLAGTVLLVIIMLFASIEAAGLLGFANLAVLLASLLEFTGQLALGLVVFGVGLFLANFAATTIRASANPQAGLLAIAARVGILVLSTAIALSQMGIANKIIELAFGLLLGSLAVAAAIAFGLGGRDVAAKQIEEWREGLKS